ncbi:MAG: glucose-6-phosphate isomerase [Gammaproteobacteria bacterium]|jgi:glucose-6-phosphate isomerase|nr:glucose-6-phosphate isomerase [Gammaproteobacteria bacterium]MBT5202300.1 glucose-6-phosphate isomerase [Gammaproteobacteria bacterium]MBT5601521.1 glucose-6-phosphate isomerase [Gammaproteobacteria bacterium]
MSMSNFNPALTTSWTKLKDLAEKAPRINDVISEGRQFNQRPIILEGLSLDLSRHGVDESIFNSLLELTEASPFSELRDGLFSGATINITENRAVGHTKLRTHSAENESALNALKDLSERIRNGTMRGHTNKVFTDIVNIGIGGSDLGPKMVCAALREYWHDAIQVHFIANVDGAEIRHLLSSINSETTLFIVSSKTFTTQETMLNADTAANWLSKHLQLSDPQSTNHMIGVTANREQALAYGLSTNNILTFSEDIGGRYSLWSGIGLSIAICVGFNNFNGLINGAACMDQHFQSAPLAKNMPVIMALLGLWYGNFLDVQSHAIVPYCERLSLLPSFLQQLDMESNGKRSNRAGEPINYSTGPIIWGQTGTNGQHAFFQLLHQGQHLVPVDFIAIRKDNTSSPTAHRLLLLNMVAQAAALAFGEKSTNEHKNYPGNRPSSILLMEELTPFNLGMLIALYEHKVFTSGAIWNINCFDQWGVELGKKLTQQLMNPDQTALDKATLRTLESLGPQD